MAHARKTRILVTLGPSTDAPGVLERLVDAGIDAVRLNLSHGEPADHARRLRALRSAARRAGRHIPVMLDLAGPKLRIGRLPPDGLELEAGSRVELLAGHAARATGRSRGPSIPVPVPRLLDQARRGDAILLKDGLVRLRVVRRAHDVVSAEVEQGGWLYSHQGIALPGAALERPVLTAKDRRDIRFGVALGADLFALSFIGSAADVRRVKRLAAGVPVVAKIERREAVDDLGAIIRESYGVLVARGDLGVELAPEQVPLLQKHILGEANRASRVTILATQMLASMERSPSPTRSEATDVANAVLDGADGLLLTGETAGGRYPVEATETLGRIVTAIESSAPHPRQVAPLSASPDDPDTALAQAAVTAMAALDAAALVVVGDAERMTALVAHGRPRAPIVVLSPNAKQARRLGLAWGVQTAVACRAAARDPRAAVAQARRMIRGRGARWFGTIHVDPAAGDRRLSLIAPHG